MLTATAFIAVACFCIYQMEYGAWGAIVFACLSIGVMTRGANGIWPAITLGGCIIPLLMLGCWLIMSAIYVGICLLNNQMF